MAASSFLPYSEMNVKICVCPFLDATLTIGIQMQFREDTPNVNELAECIRSSFRVTLAGREEKNRWAYTLVKLDDCDSEGGFFLMAVSEAL